MVCADVSLEDLLAFHTPIDDLVFEAGATLYNETDKASAVYCVRQGLIKLVRYDVSGNQRIVRFLKKSDVVALDRYLPTISNTRRSR
jgi:CRP-like cAMP-binding protein